jgi:S1-C subfamily serine protease
MDGAVVGIVTAILNPATSAPSSASAFAVPIENAAAAPACRRSDPLPTHHGPSPWK